MQEILNISLLKEKDDFQLVADGEINQEDLVEFFYQLFTRSNFMRAGALVSLGKITDNNEIRKEAFKALTELKN